MRIGELSEQTGTPVRTIRFYEDQGVIPEPVRTEAGYRDYEPGAVYRLKFVRAAKGAGLKLSEIKSILGVRDAGAIPCSHTTTVLEAKRAEIDGRIREMRQLRKDIDALLVRGASLDPSECGPDSVCHIIEADSGR